MSVLVNATRFREAHAGDWQRLDQLVTRMEKRSVRALSDDDLVALPLLYRTTLSSLSVARETSLDRALVSYLEGLTTRAYFQLYGPPVSPLRQLAGFFRREWPAAVKALWRETLFMAALTFGAAILAFLLVRSDPSWYYAIMSADSAQGRDPAASVADLRSTIYTRHDDGLGFFATYLFTHNAQIAIFSFALGFAFAAPTILLIAYNGLTMGAFVEVFAAKGLTFNIVGWLFIHGTTEIFALILAGAAGMRIGLAIAFPGRERRMDSAVRAGKTAATVMGGTVVMLVIAGMLEGIGRESITDDATRYAIGSAMLLGWLVYFYLPRRADGAVPA